LVNRLLHELTKQELIVSMLMVDKLAITLTKNPGLHDRDKHIDTHCHFIYVGK
jgi:hypothetical protein